MDLTDSYEHVKTHTLLTYRAAAIMKEDSMGQRYLQVKHFISRGIPSSLMTLVVVLTIGYGCMRVVV